MLKELRENPAFFVESSLCDAISAIQADNLKSTESNIHAALRFLAIAKEKARKKPARNRIIHRDVACRYIRIFGGETQWVKTDVDTGYPILIDKDGETRGMVDMFDRFPGPEAKALNAEILDDIPF